MSGSWKTASTCTCHTRYTRKRAGGEQLLRRGGDRRLLPFRLENMSVCSSEGHNEWKIHRNVLLLRISIWDVEDSQCAGSKEKTAVGRGREKKATSYTPCDKHHFGKRTENAALQIKYKHTVHGTELLDEPTPFRSYAHTRFHIGVQFSQIMSCVNRTDWFVS